ncbi:MAG: GLPGLI family protein [Bacteroidales bacterium]|nr:GLPGLI family protein [Bacteroidales bacterium]
MKKTLLIVIALLSITAANAQQTSGVIEYEIVTDVEKLLKFFMPEKEDVMYGMRNEWKIRKSKCTLKFSPTETIYEPVEEETDNMLWGGGNDNENIYYTNIAKGEITYIIDVMGRKTIIEDSTPKISWKVTNGMKEVAGHICMSANYNDTIMDRVVTAWFALDMPLSYGPENFQGLPGMILQIEMYNGATVYTAKKINFTESQKIDKPKVKKKTPKTSYSEYEQSIYKTMQENKKNKRPMMRF